jgi:hypothetical protein
MRISGFRALTGFVKVMIYLAVGAAMLGLVYIVGNFIYALSNANDLSHVTATNMYELPTLLADQRAHDWEAEGSGIKFRVHKIYGELSYLSMPRALVFAIFFRVFVLWGLFSIGVVQMANVFEDVSAGKPFIKENAGRLRVVGLAMVAAAIFKAAAVIATMLIFHDEIAVKGATIPWYWMAKETLSLGLLFGGLVVIVISEVFRLGNRLEEEQELTV